MGHLLSKRSRSSSQKKEKTSIVDILLGFLMAVILVGLVFFVLYLRDPSLITSPTPTPVPSSKQVVSNSLPLREIWRWSGVVATTENDPPKVVIEGDFIILATEAHTGRSEKQSTVVFEAKTGNQIWGSRLISDRPHSIAADNERVYVSYQKEVKAFDLKTGERLWIAAKQPDMKRGGLNVYSQEGVVEVYDLDVNDSTAPPNNKILFFHPQTGTSVGVEEWSGIFFRKGDFYYLSDQYGWDYSNWIQAKRERAKSDIVWTTEFKDAVRRWPIVVNDVMYLDAGDIYAVDSKTGEIYWQYEIKKIPNPETDPPEWVFTNCFISKIAYGAGILYTLKSDGSIVGLEQKTGQEVGMIQVDPSPYYFDSDKRFNYNICHTIAASDEFVAVYYDDSQEVIVFAQQER